VINDFEKIFILYFYFYNHSSLSLTSRSDLFPKSVDTDCITMCDGASDNLTNGKSFG
jgi:hypothetical protein